MNFEGQYLNYTEYKSLNGTLELVPFNLLEFECRNILNTRTQYRLKKVNVIPDEVKICIFKMIEKKNEYELIDSKNNISSESIDGYSVNYIAKDTSTDFNRKKELEKIMLDNLSGVIVDGQLLMSLGVR